MSQASTSVQIVYATPSHLQALASKLGGEPLLMRYRLTPQSLTDSWTKALARGDGMLVALGPNGPEGLAWFAVNGAFCRAPYLRLLVVASEMQSHGAGHRLLVAFEAACGPASHGWFVLCSDFNVRAQRFYQASGYREIGRLPSFVLPDVAEVIFYKPARTATEAP